MDKALRKDAEGKNMYSFKKRCRSPLSSLCKQHWLRNVRKTHSVLGGWVLLVVSWLVPLLAVPLEPFPVTQH